MKEDFHPERPFDDVADDFGHARSDFYMMYQFIRKRQDYEDSDAMCTFPEIAGDIWSPLLSKGTPHVDASVYERIRILPKSNSRRISDGKFESSASSAAARQHS